MSCTVSGHTAMVVLLNVPIGSVAYPLSPSFFDPLPPPFPPYCTSSPPPSPASPFPPSLLSSVATSTVGKRRGRKPKNTLPSSPSLLSTTEHNIFATPSQDYSVIMADGSHGSAVHGVAGSPVLLKGASSNGTMSTGTLPSSVTANISSVSVIVPATPPGGESIFLHVLLW